MTPLATLLFLACSSPGFVNDPSFHLDVNGDGYADLLRYQNNLGEQGVLERADRFLFLGGPDAFSRVNNTAEENVLRPSYVPSWDIERVSTELPDQAIYFLLGDVNGDGRSDVVGYNSFGVGDGTSGIFHGDASVGLNDTPDYRMDLGSGITSPRTVRGLGDVNCDGYDDVIRIIEPQNLVLYLGSPDGLSLDNVLTFTGDEANHVNSHALGDIDGDGCDDMMLAQEIHLGSADGPVPTGEISAYIDELSPFWVRAPMDVDGDGLHDAAIGGESTGEPPQILFGSADRSFVRAPSLLLHDHLLGDLDGDGISEFFVGDTQIATGSKNARDATVSDESKSWGTIEFPEGGGYHPVNYGPVGDIDGDGRSEYGFGVIGPGDTRHAAIFSRRRRVFQTAGNVVGASDFP